MPKSVPERSPVQPTPSAPARASGNLPGAQFAGPALGMGPTVQRLSDHPTPLPPESVMALQRTAGNQAVARLLARHAPVAGGGGPVIQAKLRVGPVGDVYEREADRIAAQVVNAPPVSPPIQRRAQEQDGQVALPAPLPVRTLAQRDMAKPAAKGGGFTADAETTRQVKGLHGRGAPLPTTVRREFEPRFGADFSHVRIHTGQEAGRLSRALDAKAFTHGTDIAFAPGAYDPATKAGKQLLAHELTHTIQQTGAAQRKPNAPVVQRAEGKKKGKFRTWLDKTFGKKQDVADPVPPEYAGLSAIERQNKAEELLTAATTAASAAMQKAEQAKTTVLGNVYDSEQERVDLTSTGNLKKFGGAEHKVARHGARRMGKSDQHGIYSQTGPIAGLNFELNSLAREIRNASPGRTNLDVSDAAATKNLVNAVKAKGLAEQMTQLADNLDAGSMENEVWARRAGLKEPGSRTFAGAEKSASDAVMGIFDLKNKAAGYNDYMKMDEQVLQGHVTDKMVELSPPEKLGSNGVQQVIAAGYARASSGVIAPISDQTARYLRFGLKANGFAPQMDDQNNDPVALGKMLGDDIAQAGEDALGKAPSSKPKRKAKSEDQQLDKEVKYLELRAMLHGKSKQRATLAQSRMDEVTTLYQQAYADYGQVDQMRKQTKGGKGTEVSVDATKRAGQAHQKLAKAGRIIDLMRQAKTQVYDESQKFEKYVGERAMSKTKRRAKQLGGLVGGIGLRVLTGGLYRVEAEQRAGGYRTAIKSKTLLEDIAKKVAELRGLMKGLDNGAHGMNKHALRAYIFFKAVSFVLQVVRDIASAVALWLGITVAGSPVGAAFATIAFYTGAAKLAIDLALLVWASIARAKTNDPMSRIVLAGQQSTQAAEVGSGAGSMGAAGLTMGLSGSTGLLSGQVQQSAFGVDPKLGTSSQFSNLKGLDYKLGGLVEVRKIADQVTLGPTILGAVPGGVTSDESHKSLQSEYVERGNKDRSAIKAIKGIFHPFNTGVKRLHAFANKSKIKSAQKMAKLGSEVYDQVEVLKQHTLVVEQESGQGI